MILLIRFSSELSITCRSTGSSSTLEVAGDRTARSIHERVPVNAEDKPLGAGAAHRRLRVRPDRLRRRQRRRERRQDRRRSGSSIDQPVHDGLEKALEAKAKDGRASPSSGRRSTNINQLIMTKIQANDTPDIALIPQPGVVANIVKRNEATALDDVVDMSALEVQHAARRARGRHHRRQALRAPVQRQRQEPGLLQQEGLGQGGLQGPDDHRRARRADRPDQGRRPRAVVHGHRERHRHRLAGHRLVRGRWS